MTNEEQQVPCNFTKLGYSDYSVRTSTIKRYILIYLNYYIFEMSRNIKFSILHLFLRQFRQMKLRRLSINTVLIERPLNLWFDKIAK